MSERKWPNIFGHDYIGKISQKIAENWLEANLSREELDRLAPNEYSHLDVKIGSNTAKFYCVECGAYLNPTTWEKL